VAFVQANAHESASWVEFTLNQQPHCHSGGVPAAGGQSTENRAQRRRFIEMEGLRVKLSSERKGPFPVDAQSPGTLHLPHCEIFQVAFAQLIHDSTPASDESFEREG
jgi:hypothetical protein